jgi:XTP/dITP diphosphohydrolase
VSVSEAERRSEPTVARIVLATRNRHKLAELTRILSATGLDVELASLDEFPGAPEVAETGVTFEENALLKARAIARFTSLPAVADDSGICVSVMNDMPGAFSALWAGRHGDDAANLRVLLGQLADVGPERRAAHFTCVAALVIPGPDGTERVAEGRLDGRLTRAPRGENGFGYDPIFVPDGDDRTTAEMTPDEKDAISHRGRAFRALARVIADLLAGERR